MHRRTVIVLAGALLCQFNSSCLAREPEHCKSLASLTTDLIDQGQGKDVKRHRKSANKKSPEELAKSLSFQETPVGAY